MVCGLPPQRKLVVHHCRQPKVFKQNSPKLSFVHGFSCHNGDSRRDVLRVCLSILKRPEASIHSKLCPAKIFRQWHQVSAQYPAHVKGTGVLVDYEGYPCIVAGKHLLPSPVAASTALVHFVLPGIQCPVTVSTWQTYPSYCSRSRRTSLPMSENGDESGFFVQFELLLPHFLLGNQSDRPVARKRKLPMSDVLLCVSKNP